MDASSFDRAAWLLGDEWERTRCPSCGVRESQWPDLTEEKGHCAACEAGERIYEAAGEKRPKGMRVEFVKAQPDDAPLSRFVDPNWAENRGH